MDTLQRCRCNEHWRRSVCSDKRQPSRATLDGQHNDGLVLYALVRERKVREANPQLSRYRGVRIKEKQQGALG